MSYLFFDTQRILHFSQHPDATVSAAALVHGFTVITSNTDDITRLGVPTLTITMKP